MRIKQTLTTANAADVEINREMINNIFKNTTINPKNLLEYGFMYKEGTYTYSCELLDGEFILKVEIDTNKNIKTQVIETDTNEIYTLHLTDAEGSFVGKIREEYTNILEDIAKKCFDKQIFKFPQTIDVIKYIKNKYNDDVEYLWEKFPDNAVTRRKDNQKWYLAILTVKKEKLGIDSQEKVEVIDLRAKTEELPELIKQKNIYPGYHMNKKHWISIILDNTTKMEDICNRIDESYNLATK